MRVVAFVMLAMATAHADPVNLLARPGAIVNVGSTVANQAIKPEHLVDGKLDTAWNSRTGDLVGAWIVVRLRANVRVQSVKLTVGFTKVDPKLGDLFVENPRIKKVRVTHGKTVVDKDLDIANRGLQEIPIAGDGGDYRIDVLAVEMGTKKTWREICISELEVWGTSATPMAGTAVPSVYVHSFTPPPLLSEAECTRLLGPANVSASVHVLSDRYGVCEMVETGHPQDPYDLRRHSFTLVALPGKQARAQTVEIDTQVFEGLGEATDTRLKIDTLLVGDDGLLVAALASSTWNNLPDADPATIARPSTRFTVYRPTAVGLVEVLEIEGTEACGFSEGTSAAKSGKPQPALDYTCGTTTKHFGFDGTRYVRR